MSEEELKQMDKEQLLGVIKAQQFEIERLNKECDTYMKIATKKDNIINECAEDILKELEENHHLSYGVALATRQKLLDYKELKGSDKE